MPCPVIGRDNGTGPAVVHRSAARAAGCCPHDEAHAEITCSRKWCHYGTRSAGARADPSIGAWYEHRRSAWPPSVAVLRAVDLLEDLCGDTERFQAGGYAAIGADLQQNLLDLV